MGIAKYNAEWIFGVLADAGSKGRVLTLGRQDTFITTVEALLLLQHLSLIADHAVQRDDTRVWVADSALAELLQALNENGHLAWKGGSYISDVALFRLAGFEEVVSVDVSAYEKADILFDLNRDGLLEAVGGHENRFDVCIDAGTSEHVFNIPQVFKNIFDILDNDGIVIHSSPSNNHVDHGFYQFSPTLLYDYYSENQFVVLKCDFVQYTTRHETVPWQFQPYVPGSLDPVSFGGLDGKMYAVNFAARKQAISTYAKVPMQGAYKRRAGW